MAGCAGRSVCSCFCWPASAGGWCGTPVCTRRSPVSLSELSPAFWGILVALPVGKLIGITLGGWLGSFTKPKAERSRIPLFGLVTIGALGGIGFTVSLLMNELAFAGDELVRSEGT